MNLQYLKRGMWMASNKDNAWLIQSVWAFNIIHKNKLYLISLRLLTKPKEQWGTHIHLQIIKASCISCLLIISHCLTTYASDKLTQTISRCILMLHPRFFAQMHTVPWGATFTSIINYTRGKGKVAPVLNSLSTTTWRHIREWMYRSTFSWPRHELEVSGELHDPAA
jgi:hypothetical protein